MGNRWAKKSHLAGGLMLCLCSLAWIGYGPEPLDDLLNGSGEYGGVFRGDVDHLDLDALGCQKDRDRRCNVIPPGCFFKVCV